MPTFYKPVLLPEYCFLSEAVQFLALGRTPEVSWAREPERDDQGNYYGVDFRFDWREMPDNFEPDDTPLNWFEPQEFEFLSFDYPDDYNSLAEEILFGEISSARRDVRLVERSVKQGEIRFRDIPEFQQRAEEARKFLKRNESRIQRFWAINNQFETSLERAWAKIFDLIHSGELTVEAIDEEKFNRHSDDEDYERAAAFQEIEPSMVRLNHNFKENSISNDQKKFVATRTLTEPIANLFLAINTPKLIQSEQYGQSIVARENPIHVSRRRGAPHALRWDLLRSHLKELVANGTLPDKKDACIYLLIEHAERTQGRSVGRTTVQTRLKAELDELFAQNPN